jgi:subtilisin family serine protease
MKLKKLAVLFFLSSVLFAQELSQTFISLKNTGVEEFLTNHPEYDGRGTIIFVFDTGIDIGISGLLKTSNGEDKVIDVQDFTKQGDIKFYPADKKASENKFVFSNKDKKLSVSSSVELKYNSLDEKYFIGVLPETIWMNSGSGVRDINGNKKTDDQFLFVTYRTKIEENETWVLVLDTDLDGDLGNNKELRNYKENHDSFVITNPDGLPYFTMALNIIPEESKVSFFFDDGGHGTHCAGITTGFQIGDEKLNGVAPGAYLIGLKLGNNNYAGGASVTESMKKCYLYVDKISKERKEPCIITMSFGIGSEIEGRAEMEKFLEELTAKNPYLYICTSNGNEGPGISSSGLPAASYAVFASGAVLAEEVGNDLYGSLTGRDIILHFSSRGGELQKPDIVSPGAAASTVPNYAGGDVSWGTSMASPYTAGVFSLLLSAAQKEFPDVKIPSQLLYKIIRESGTKLACYNHVDQGGGLINVNAAYELMRKYIRAGEIKKFETYTITSFSPNMPDEQAPNLYIRNGNSLTGNENFSFSIKRNNLLNQNKFYRIYNLKSDADWLIPIQKKLHLRNSQTANVDVKFDISKMSQHGLYNAKIKAYRADESKFPEFEMMATIVKPYEFNSSNNFSQSWKNEELAPGMHKRYFLNIPANASDISVKVQSQKGKYTSIRMYLHNPDGIQEGFAMFNPINKEDIFERHFYNLTPGVYELVVLGNFTAKSISAFDLTIEVNSVTRINSHVLSQNENIIELINSSSLSKSYSFSGTIDGYQKEYFLSLDSVETFDIPFSLQKGERSKSFELLLSKEDFNKVTDFALMIYDEQGKTLSSSGLSYRNGEISVQRDDSNSDAKYTFTLVPGYTHKAGNMKIKILEKTFFANPTNIKIKQSSLTLFPSVVKSVQLDFKKPESEKPTEAFYFGSVVFKSPKSNIKEFELPLTFNL